MNAISHPLFSPFAVGPYVLKNRIVALPVFTGYAGPEGYVTRLLLDHYARLGASGAALVVVANAAVAADGRTSTHSLRADHDRYIPGLARLAQVIRDGGALACLQLNHAGQYARADQPRLCAAPQPRHLRFKVAAFKALMEFFPFEQRYGLTRRFLRQANTWRRGMTASEQARVVDGFCEAARRARKAGFNFVELHGANGYLISQYLSAFYNNSAVEGLPDAVERRTFPLELVRAVRQHLPGDFPVGFRLMLAEWVPRGIDLDEALGFASRLEDEGIAYLSPSAGTFTSIFRPDIRARMHQPGYLIPEVTVLASSVKVPVIALGRVHTPTQAVRSLRETSADLIGLGRALRIDPEWVRKARQARTGITACIDCMSCIRQVVLEKGFNCACWPAAVRRKIDLEHSLLTRNYRMLVLVQDRATLPCLVSAAARLWPASNPFETPLHLTLAGPENQTNLLADAARKIGPCLAPGTPVDTVVPDREIPGGAAIERFVTQSRDGMILLARRPEQPWQTRLAFRLRQRVLVLAGDHADQDRMLVCVDLSDTTLMILTFLKHVVLPKTGLSAHAVHLSAETPKTVQLRWRRMKKICGLEPALLPLEVIRPEQPVARQILDLAHDRACGTVLMGKRGLSGIKRLVLGSVSAKVLGGVDRETLILVD